ncbi:hypothetical protein [Rhodanobacter denitrificans]|uniref:hypothetical protein n=1 Tax=Rhodanobacter denitrificans TaxID=666685 RepID=UPI001F3213B5|nr:hypothetical protein [Rhodanobacter denitrificans]UJJ60622.1 hypothetical protein LRK55_19500 [Rhodanobacter denitrificans]
MSYATNSTIAAQAADAESAVSNTRLLETVANLASWAGYFEWVPEDSREVSAACIRWAVSFEKEFAINVATGLWEEDAYIEEVDTFAMAKLKGVEHECLKALVWPVRA